MQGLRSTLLTRRYISSSPTTIVATKPPASAFIADMSFCSASFPAGKVCAAALQQARARHSHSHHLFFIRCYSSSSSAWPSVSCSPPPPVDLSEYLLSGSDWQKAPKCSDYIGPVRIGRTPDGRGRGLYVTQDVTAGDVLIISNAFATTYNDSNKDDMYSKIASIVRESPRALRQFYSLAGLEYQDEMGIPDVRLFDSAVPYRESQPLEFNEDRIRHIIQVNSFSGKLIPQSEVKINGLWLLPSFMNHSCCPTASRLLVGETMFFMASQDMKAKDEITICYSDCMAPLKKRENVLGRMGYGFQCQCKRCMTERSVQKELQEIIDQYDSLYDKASDEVYSVVTRREKGPYRACEELAGVFYRLKEKVGTLENLTKLQKQWILGGYSPAFLANWLTVGYSTDFAPSPTLVNPMAFELVEAMKATMPGMLHTLSFTVLLATAVQGKEDRLRLVQLAMDECVRIYGKQRPDVIKKLAQHSVEFVPFG